MGTGLDGDNSALIAVFCLTEGNLSIVKIECEVSSTHYGIAPDTVTVGS